MSAKNPENGFLSRWSRRKLETKEPRAPETEERPDEDVPAGKPAAKDAPAEAAARDEPVPRLTEEDVEKLGPESDYTPFMKKGVSADVQRLALRKLWRSDPLFSFQDGLTDYADDYRGEAAASLGKVVTSWKPGQGFLTDEEVTAAKGGEKVAKAAPGEGPAADATADESAEAEPPEEAAEATPAADDGHDTDKA